MRTILHQSDSRGRMRLDWLDARHTFSFGSYLNRDRMQFGQLRVLNDDIIQPGKGFDTHPHDNMEIISIPLAGQLKHRDTMGNESVIQAGEIQVMSAGSGVYHSEFNPSDTELVNLLQIWVMPASRDTDPRYDQKAFDQAGRTNQFQLVVSPDGRDDSLAINQNAFFSRVELDADQTIDYTPFSPQNGVYVFMIEGQAQIAEHILQKRDGLAISDPKTVTIVAQKPSSILVMEVPQ